MSANADYRPTFGKHSSLAPSNDRRYADDAAWGSKIDQWQALRCHRLEVEAAARAQIDKASEDLLADEIKAELTRRGEGAVISTSQGSVSGKTIGPVCPKPYTYVALTFREPSTKGA